MRLQIAVLATAMLAVMMTGAMSARASRSPVPPVALADVVGNWGANQECTGAGAFSYVRSGGNVQQVVHDGPREYRTPVTVKFARNRIGSTGWGATRSTSTRLLVLMIEMKRSGQSVNGVPGVSTIFGVPRAPLAINPAKN